MVWVFTRDGQQLRCEVASSDAGTYRIVITRPDRTQSIEEVEQPAALVERTAAVMQELREGGWDLA